MIRYNNARIFDLWNNNCITKDHKNSTMMGDRRLSPMPGLSLPHIPAHLAHNKSTTTQKRLSFPLPLTPPEIKTNTDQLATPPPTAVSEYPYDTPQDYFRYRSSPQQQGESTFASPLENLATADGIFSEDYLYGRTFAGLARSSSMLSSNAASPGLESYMPLPTRHQFLCVDDNSLNLKILHRLLRKLFPNAVVHTTLDPIAAAEMARQSHYDMCFLDIEMPLMSGKELAVDIRSHNSSVGLIAVTTRAGASDLILYQEVGFDTTFPKPLRMPYSDMVDSVEAIIARRRAN